MTAPDWTELAHATAVPEPRARQGALEPATRLRTSPIPAIVAVVGGGIRRMPVQVYFDTLRDGALAKEAQVAMQSKTSMSTMGERYA
jgi:hypothetical protein